MYDLLISNGFVIDGTGASRRIHATIVNGVPIVLDGKISDESARPGQVLRPGTRA
jgi:N-acyl-D-aspartate/D-glutamate deacylase